MIGLFSTDQVLVAQAMNLSALAVTASALVVLTACSGASSRSEQIGDSLYECRSDGEEATVVVDGIRLHYDDSWGLYIQADAYSESAGIRSAKERADWGSVADFVDDCVIPRPSRLLRE